MKKRMRIPLRLILIVLVMLFAVSGVASAANVDDLQNQKKEIDSQIQNKQSELNKNQKEQDSAEAQLATINNNLDTVQAEIDKLYDDLAVAEKNLANQQVEYDNIVTQLENSQEQLRTRVSAIYKNGDISYLDVIFSSEDIEDFISGFIFLGKIVEQDQAVIASINENKVLAQKKLNELEETRNSIIALQKQKEAQEAEYTKQADAKNALLDTLESQEAALNKEIDEMQAQSGSIASEINSYYASLSVSEPAYTYTGTGVFTWPLSIRGSLSSKFGYRIHPISGTRKFHSGIDIAAPKGTPVLAAESGTVITVKTLSTGYGHYVVISHGSSIATLYGHMSSINVTAGQSVSRGQQIGGVGTTGSSTGNHLHFEVRVNGSAVQPFNYVQ